MRFKKLGTEDVGESESLRSWDPVTGEEVINYTDQELAATPPLEEEPEARDILPDQIQEFRRGEGEEEEEPEVTVRPHDSLHPLLPNELPEG